MAFLTALTSPIDKALHGLTPSQIVLLVVLLYAGTQTLPGFIRAITRQGIKKVLFRAIFPRLKRLGQVKAIIEKENAKSRKDFEHSLLHETAHEEKFLAIPEKGVPAQELLKKLREWKNTEDAKWKNGKVSGAVYYGDEKLSDFCGEVYKLFALSNPLHPDVFPFVRKMEAEVIAMCLNLFHGGPQACGSMTSGGTESILMAMKAYRDWGNAERGITRPEIVVPLTAHAAFWKAGDAFGIEVIEVPVDQQTFRLTVNQVKKYVTRNTICIVGSSPHYPQGVIDDIEGLSEFARLRGIPFHADCCLGSFILPFAEKLGFKLPLYDFRNPGVTSISMDTHKFGFAPKGSSVVMYSDPIYRQYQYFTTPEWTGGIYATPSLPGSRPGALIAVTWATLLTIGQDGYLKSIQGILDTAHQIQEGTNSIEGIKVLGKPELMVVSFGSSDPKINIYGVADAMKKRGYNLNSLQNPPAFHICLTQLSVGKGEVFVEDLRDSVAEVKADPEKSKGASAAMYGMAGSLPDSSLIGDAAKLFMDVYYTA